MKLPKFIILGTGEREKIFKEYAERLSLDCVFTGKLPYNQMCGWIATCDIAVNPITHNAAQSIINKHGDYASAGLPVINTQENVEYRNLVEQYNMGFNCENGNPNDLSEKIQILIHNDDLRIDMGIGARKCAEERFDRRNTYNHLINIITG